MLPMVLVALAASSAAHQSLGAENPDHPTVPVAAPNGKAVPLGSFETLFTLTPAPPGPPAPAQAGLPQPAAVPPAVGAMPPSSAQPASPPQQPTAIGQPVPALATSSSPLAPAASPPLTPTGVPKALILRLAGSDGLEGRLMLRLASGYLAWIGDGEIQLALDRANHAAEVSGLQGAQREAISIASSSSAAGFAALLHGAADIVVSPRRMLPAEAGRLSPLADMASPANETVIGVQRVAVVVNPVNRVSSLAMSQLRGILDGRLTDWSQVGGLPGPIHLYVVDDHGGAADVPQDALLGPSEVASTANRVATEQMLATAVAADLAGIGFTASGNTGATKALSVAEGGSTAAASSGLSIMAERYPLSRRLYLYANPASSSQLVKRFASYVLSGEGQSSVAAEGLAPPGITLEPVATPDTASGRLKQLTAGATRLSLDFRFQAGASELDGRAARDVELLASHLRSQRIDPSRLIVAGFTDNSGAPAANQAVSQRRAEAVAAALARAGAVPGKVATFGAEFPAADNATPEGRERNRRIEVYLAPQQGRASAIGSPTGP